MRIVLVGLLASALSSPAQAQQGSGELRIVAEQAERKLQAEQTADDRREMYVNLAIVGVGALLVAGLLRWAKARRSQN